MTMDDWYKYAPVSEDAVGNKWPSKLDETIKLTDELTASVDIAFGGNIESSPLSKQKSSYEEEVLTELKEIKFLLREFIKRNIGNG